MTQPAEAVAGAVDASAQNAPEPTIEDRFAALIDDGEDVPENQDDGAVDPVGTGEEQELAPEDVPDEVGDDLPAIDLPKSWPEEDRAFFSGLPRAAQERLQSREAEREKFIQTKSQEAARSRQSVETQANQRISDMHALHLQAVQALAPQVPEEPSAHLLTQDPQRYAYEMESRRAALREREAIGGYLQQLNAQHDQMVQQQRAADMQASVERLQTEFPEFLASETRADLVKKIEATGTALGYSPEMLGQVNADDILALRTASQWRDKAEKYDALMATKMQKVRDAKALPRVSRPGASGTKGAASVQQYQSDRAAMRNGDREAATRVFERFV